MRKRLADFTRSAYISVYEEFWDAFPLTYENNIESLSAL